MIGRYLNGKNTEEPIREKRESADDSYWLIQEVEGRSQGKNENGLIFLANTWQIYIFGYQWKQNRFKL